MKKTEKILELPESTWLALAELAEITGADDVETLLQDALRTYEWLISQQLAQYIIVPLSQEELDKLHLPSSREALEDLIEEGAEKKAKKYFADTAGAPAASS